MKYKNILIKFLTLAAYLAMISINALANILLINGVSTGEISNNYFNLFAPTGFTFSIWGIIYLMLGAYIIYQFFGKNINNRLIKIINIYFIISSILNILWIFAWHFNLIFFSVLLIILILVCLIKIANLIRQEKLLLKEKFFVSWPFSLYFAWITIATIANITTFLVSINWSGWGLADNIWTMVILIIGAFIGIVRMIWDKNFIYGLVFIWAYIGILFRHISDLNSQYVGVINVLYFCLFLFLIAQGYLVYRLKR
jgi:hypothetical protein